MRGYLWIVAVLALTACSSTRDGGDASAAAPTGVGASVTSAPPPRPTDRACVAADLPATAARGPVGAAAGTTFSSIVLRNVGRSRCTLAGYPTLLNKDDAGRAQEIPVGRGAGVPFDSGAGAEYPATVDPGESLRVWITTSVGCSAATAKPRVYSHVTVVVAEKRIAVPELVLTSTCQINIGAWHRSLAAS